MPVSTKPKPTSKWTNILIGLAVFIFVTPFFNYLLITKSTSQGNAELLARNAALESRLRKMEAPARTSSEVNPASPLVVKANSINSYWWPKKEDGGLLGKIHALQHPADCSSQSTKFFVWRSKREGERDTRGLTAFAHAGSSHLLHALTDGDALHLCKGLIATCRANFVSRILITDDKVWPMAKGCRKGPETRECYFEPLSSCKLADLDEMHTGNSTVLIDSKQEYDRSLRTVYSSRKLWFRLIDSKYSWTGLPGEVKDHSHVTLSAASLAYYFRPKPWLRSEIDERIRRSIPIDLNPDRTIGVPIRRSDKCQGHNITGSAGGELDCPALLTYLQGVKKFIAFDPHIENVIVTSEDKLACDEFLLLMKKELPLLRVVLNVGDVQQGTGSGDKLKAYVKGSDNSNVVASALTSMHMHLRARYFVITSKSTWTSTISVMARVYGFASEVIVLDIGRNTNIFGAMARSGCEEGARLGNVPNTTLSKSMTELAA